MLMALAAGISMASIAMAVPGQPSAGFTRGSHTTRRRIDPVQRLRPTKDLEVARWNAEVDRRKAERKGARRA
ncbi:hypothetical protein [Variovorax sp. dw_954]|uniref:hypothetical protein n=1 Tax=Variovorax sp. dw_954 TaxID=2720078 RepID=UPI001BD23685|nr:hypothetical protein [Variovorax sp. dw_954]